MLRLIKCQRLQKLLQVVLLLTPQSIAFAKSKLPQPSDYEFPVITYDPETLGQELEDFKQSLPNMRNQILGNRTKKE